MCSLVLFLTSGFVKNTLNILSSHMTTSTYRTLVLSRCNLGNYLPSFSYNKTCTNSSLRYSKPSKYPVMFIQSESLLYNLKFVWVKNCQVFINMWVLICLFRPSAFSLDMKQKLLGMYICPKDLQNIWTFEPIYILPPNSFLWPLTKRIIEQVPH